MRPSTIASRVIAFNRAYVSLTGSVTAALFLSQACYWSDKKDWEEFYKTQEEWEGETGLSRSEQETARKKLREIGVLVERYARLEHRMYYRIDRDKIDALLISIPECRNPAVGEEGIPQSLHNAEITTNIPPTPKGDREDFFGEEADSEPPPRFTPQQKRLNKLYNRSNEDPWNDDLKKAWRKLKSVSDEDLTKVERFYSFMRKSPDRNYSKRSLLVLIRQWDQVADAARTFKEPTCL